MQLVLVRHAEAYPLGEQGATSDFDRPLTDLGRRQATALAAAFQARGIVPAVVLPSPLVRAVQTAAPLLEQLAGENHAPETTELLSPEGYGPKRLSKFVTRFEAGPVVLVGHNPSISDYARWLLNGEAGAVEMDKAAAALIDCPDGPGKGGGVLRWLVSPEWFMVS
jgi:phosphohistidine phosphatase